MRRQSLRSMPRRAVRPGVEAMEARRLLTSFVVVNIDDAGAGSLRQAILDANAAPGLDAINFSIPGAGAHTIRPLSPLPTISDPVSIDGFTQPGAHPNTLTASDDAVRLIGLDGAGLVGDGLHITAGGSTVRGLAITRFVPSTDNVPGGHMPDGGNGILLDGGGGNVIEGNALGIDVEGNPGGNVIAGLSIRGTSSGNTVGGMTPGARNIVSGNLDGVAIGDLYSTTDGNLVAGNFIGITAVGARELGNTAVGLSVTGSSRNTIGGAVPGARNVISGNGQIGIFLANSFFGSRHSDANQVEGNYIGTDASGMHALGNGRTSAVTGQKRGGVGVEVGGDLNTIGGSAPGAGNLISGNFGGGIEVQGHISSNIPSTGKNNLIRGNRIGTDAIGTGALGNTGPNGAVYIQGTTGNTIGGPAAGDGNIIAFNGGPGVQVFAYQPNSGGNAILSNAITSNARLGIEVSGGSPSGSGTVMDVPRPPVLNSAVAAAGSTTVAGTLASVPATTYTIQFFADGTETSGPAEGRKLLGEATATTDASGNASFAATLPVVVAPGEVITATATNAVVGSSGFSAAVAYVADLAIAQSADPMPVTAGAELRITITLSNAGPSAASGVVLTDVMPPGAAFVSASQGVYDPATNTLTAALGPLPAGGSAMVVLVLRPATAGTILNTARVRGVESDPTPGDDSSTLWASIAPDGPRVTGLRRVGGRLVLTFSAALDPKRSRDLRSYVFALPAVGGRREHQVRVRSAAYDPASRSVTLRPAVRLDARRSYRITVRGTGPHSLSDTGGLLLDGRGDGHPGSDYLATLPAWHRESGRAQ